MTLLAQRTPRRRAIAREAPALVAVSHGTSSPAGQVAVAALVAAIGAARPNLAVSAGFVDVQQPDAPSALASLGARAAVVVPLLLSAGYHVHVDLARQSGGATVSKALGPDDRLAQILQARLVESGLRPGDRVVLACAGSRDHRAVDDCREMGARLSGLIGRPVRVGFLSAATPRLADAVETERSAASSARVVVSSYLLAPGYFAGLARATVADVTTAPLLLPHVAPPAVLVELVLHRYAEALAR
ncbi:sirohydrochlorin chelatase [Parafrigoribacterium soli]|uniref:sirohydrochlorin chelatase n=1 Tax=Parafrigoribacterium soli TaxID=3144663 RepID=UPI0032EEA46A